MRTFSKHLLAAAMALAATAASAQDNGSNSPYSRYGFGLLGDRAGGFNKGMSGLSYGMRDGKELNPQNPASYSAIDSLSFLFDIGMSLQYSSLESGGRRVNANNTSFDYLTMGFRASHNLGMSLGLIPYSTIGYSMNTSERLENATTGEITQTNTYSGEGGLHQVYFGIGWKPFKGFSLGANVGYLWGELTHTAYNSFSDATIATNRHRYETDIRTYTADFGIQYEQALGKNDMLTLGLTYGMGHDVNRNAYYYNQTVMSGTVASGDTLTAANAYALPHNIGVGLAWRHKNSLRVGVDYNFQKWADVKYPTLVNQESSQLYVPATGGFSNRHRVTVGAEYIPNPNGSRWRQLVRYRMGFSMATPYTKVNGQDGPYDYNVSLGVGLPIINRWNNRSILNISAQYERVQPKVAGMITENYLRLCIGISFNERWFMKWQVE